MDDGDLGLSRAGQLVAPLPSPALMVPDLIGVRRAHGDPPGVRPTGRHAAPRPSRAGSRLARPVSPQNDSAGPTTSQAGRPSTAGALTVIDLPRIKPEFAPAQGAPRSRTLSSRYVLLRSRWTLLGILAAQIALSVRLVWSNTAFQDESLYIWAGRLEWAHWLHGSYVPAFATYFSGAPVIYPPLAALADSVGGLAAARILSLAFMVTATILLYLTAKRLLGRGTALAATALFSVFGMADQLGSFATYDAMALCLIALAAWLVVRATGRGAEFLLVLAAGALALAAATKYASALWDPVVIVLAALAASQSSASSRAWRAARLTIYTVAIDVASLFAGGADYRRGIMFTTVERQIVTGTAPLKILDIAWGWLALLLLLGILGVLLAWLDGGRITALPALLFAAALLAPAEQARISDITSLHKHVAFGAWFLCIIAGYAVNRISQIDGQMSHGIIIAAVLVAAFGVTGYSQSASVVRSWPSVSHIMPALGGAISQSGCPCLVLQQNAAEYYLPPSELKGQVIGPYTFTYHDSEAWEALSGPTAMAAAIRNDYFAVVEVDASRGLPTYRLLENSLRQSGLYRQIASQSWSMWPASPTQVWVRIAGSGN